MSLPEHTIFHGDSLVTDPPAGIGFMQKSWDSNKGGRNQWIAWLDKLMQTNTAASWWEGRKSGVLLPGLDTYERLKSVLDLDGRFDALIEWAEAEREAEYAEIARKRITHWSQAAKPLAQEVLPLEEV